MSAVEEEEEEEKAASFLSFLSCLASQIEMRISVEMMELSNPFKIAKEDYYFHQEHKCEFGSYSDGLNGFGRRKTDVALFLY